MIPRNIFHSCPLALALIAIWMLASPRMAANLIANGDFSANASAFTTWPGYLGGGANPQIQSWSFMDLSGGAALAGINGPTTAVGVPFAPTSAFGYGNFAFIQSGDAALVQNLPTLLPNQEYRISVAAANRSGNPNALGRIQIGDATTVFYDSGNQSFSTAAFQTITATFTTPSTFNGTPSIQLYGFQSATGDTVAYTNVMLGKPVFRAEGANLTALDGMLQRFYPPVNMDIAATFAIAWLPQAMLWVADSPQAATSPMRARIANRIGNMRLSADGYVSCHQHEGLAHSEGWPFPLPTQGGGIGYYFTNAGQPYGQEFGINPTTQVDGWQLSGASGTTVDPARGWPLQLTAPNATITSPAFDLNAFVSPFIRVKWDATGLPEGSQPYLAWTTAMEPQFSTARRMAFPQASSSSSPPVLDFDIPVHEITGAQGRITRLRIGFGNPAPGQVTIQRLFSSVDSRHTVNNSNYLIAAADFFEWTGDKPWLSNNLAKMRRATDYLISEFQVREAHLLRTPWVGHDGRSGLEILPDGRKVIHHGAGVGGNYWDLIPFGGDDALATIYLYSALRRMARIERFATADSTISPPAAGLDAAALDSLADAVRVKFQQTFWNPETKRFAPKDNLGRFRDYGFTFLNNEAMYYGLASATQAREILDWTNGFRAVNGDTSQREDIYRWRFGPRATTKRNIEYYAYVWSSPESINFGDQVQDGGAVLGFTYHDLMARIRHINPDNAWQRLREILTWYDEVEAAGGPREYYSVPGRGTLQGGGPPGGLGIDQEFYESVLAPAIILDGFIGFSVRPDGFDLAPRLPSSVQSLGLSDVVYRDLRWDIDLSRDSITFRVTSGSVDAPLRVRLPAGAWTATFRSTADAEPQTVEIASGPQGFELPAGPLHELRLVNPQMTSNLILNADFSANVSAFTSWPGYLGSGENPHIQSWSFMAMSNGLAGINGPTTGVGEPFAPAGTDGFSSFAFIQNGAVIYQELPTLLPNQRYRISVAAANRSGYPNGLGRIQIGDATTVFHTSGNRSFSTAAFQTIAATFTTPSTFNGMPSIQLYGLSTDGDAVAYTNVVLEAVPETFAWDPAMTGTGTAGGSGNWNDSSNFWWDGTLQTSWPSVSTGKSEAVFAGTPGTVTLDPAGVTASTLNFTTAGYTLTGGPLTLAGSSTLLSPAGTTTIDASLDGSDPITLSGGAFILKQPGYQTHITRLHGNLGGSSKIGVSVDDAFGTGTVILGNGDNVFFSALGSTRSFSNAFEWRGNRLIVDSDDMGTGLSAFPLEMGSLLLAGTAPSDFFLRRALTVNGEVSGSGPAGRSLYFVGDANIMALNHPANTFTGTLTWENNTILEVVADGSMGNPSNALSFDAGNGMVRLWDSFDSARPISVNGDTSARIDTNGFDSTWSGGITGTNAVNSRLSKVGAGTLTLGGTNFLGGGTKVDGGTLMLPAGASLTHGNTWDNSHGIAGGATFHLNGGSMLVDNSFYAVGNGLNPSSEALFHISSGTYTHNGGQVLVGFNGHGRFIMDGGTATINHLAYGDGGPSRTAIAELNGGTLALAQMNRRGGDAAATIKLNGTILTARENQSDFMQVGTAGSTEFLVGSGGAKFDTAGFNISVLSDLEHDSSVIGADGGLEKSGDGTLTLSGNNTYRGDTRVHGGVLAVNGNSIPDTGKLVINAAKVEPAGAETVHSLYFGPAQQAAGTWGSTASSATHKNDTYFSGTGVINVTSGPTGYAAWIGGFAVTDPSPCGDPDNDGMKNLIEYALNGNPSVSDSAILPDLVITATDFEFTYSRLDLSLADTVQTFEYGSDLAGWFPVVIPTGPGVDLPVGAAKVTIIDTGSTDSVKISIPRSANVGGKLFGRLKVVK